MKTDNREKKGEWLSWPDNDKNKPTIRSF